MDGPRESPDRLRAEVELQRDEYLRSLVKAAETGRHCDEPSDTEPSDTAHPPPLTDPVPSTRIARAAPEQPGVADVSFAARSYPSATQGDAG